METDMKEFWLEALRDAADTQRRLLAGETPVDSFPSTNLAHNERYIAHTAIDAAKKKATARDLKRALETNR